MDVTQSLANAVTAAMDKLAGTVEPAALQALKDEVAQIIQAETAAISQAGQVVNADLKPVVDQLARFNDSLEAVVPVLVQLSKGFQIVPIAPEPKA